MGRCGNNMTDTKHIASFEVQSNKNENNPYNTVASLIHTISEAFGKGVIIFDTDLNVVTHNAAALKHSDLPRDLYKTGRSGKAIIDFATKRGDFGPNVDAETHWNTILEMAAKRELNSETVRRTCPDGRVIQTRRLFCRDGSIIVLSEDLTETIQKEQLLDLALGGGAGYWNYSLKTGKFKFSDSILERLSEDELKHIEDEGIWSLTHPDDLNKARANWSNAFKTAETMDFSYRLVLDKSGVVYQRVIGIPMFSGDGRIVGVTCFVTDQTEDRASIQALRRRAQDAERAVKTQNRHIANMSHEIRTPMNGVLGMTEALLQNDKANDITDELTIIRDSANMLLKLMDDTLDHAKMSADKLKIIPELSVPRKILKNVKALWAEKAGVNNTELNLAVLDKVPETLIIDPLRYQQCLNNLLSNAVKFTENGKIDIISTIVDRGGRPFFVTAIRDTGIGMTPEQLADVFTPFQQATDHTTAQYGGTGLGMSIVKQLAGLMGGKITAKSEQGKGTTFALTLPLKRREEERRVLPRATQVRRESTSDLAKPVAPARKTSNIFDEGPKEFDLSKLTVLVAEDNQINQLVVRSLLEPRIAEIVIVDNGQEAIDVLQNRHIDVILMDIHMPIMDGIEATIAIRNSESDWANTKIIALTADPEYQQVRICRNIGMNHALPKPLNFTDLIAALETVFKNEEQPALQIA